MGRRQVHNPNAPNFDETQEEQWKMLREEMFASDEDEALPSSGDLNIPQLPSAKKAAVKKVKKTSPTPPLKALKTRQRTLEQATADVNMERLMRKYELDDNVEVEDDLDMAHLLQADNESDDDDDDGHLNAASRSARRGRRSVLS